MAKIVLRRVTKSFGSKVAVDDLNLEVEDGEFVIVVGPSGCGKTTTLRMIAGFEAPTMGTLHIGDTLMNHVPPKDRNLAMVFQNYALFPHMSVARNLSYGLRVRHTPKKEVDSQVHEIAEMLGILPLLDSRPSQLSGGERQRVALGRALLRKPQAFLLDEPLSNLDAALRAQMRFELKRIHAQFPVTTVYVTHDQVEAMTMADRIVLMNHGELQQVARPETLYAEPANVFVAGFIGSPKINLIAGQIDHPDGASALRCLAATIPVTPEIADRLRSVAGRRRHHRDSPRRHSPVLAAGRYHRAPGHLRLCRGDRAARSRDARGRPRRRRDRHVPDSSSLGIGGGFHHQPLL